MCRPKLYFYYKKIVIYLLNLFFNKVFTNTQDIVIFADKKKLTIVINVIINLVPQCTFWYIPLYALIYPLLIDNT